MDARGPRGPPRRTLRALGLPALPAGARLASRQGARRGDDRRRAADHHHATASPPSTGCSPRSPARARCSTPSRCSGSTAPRTSSPTTCSSGSRRAPCARRAARSCPSRWSSGATSPAPPARLPGGPPGLGHPPARRACGRTSASTRPCSPRPPRRPAGRTTGPSPARSCSPEGSCRAASGSEIERTALALFRRGSEIAAANGLILVDTKYEFGLRRGEL